MKYRWTVVAVLVLAYWLTPAHCQNPWGPQALADLPHWPRGEMGIVVAVVPPQGTVPETDQWPAAAWLEINEVPFVIYAKHLDGYNPETRRGKLAVWLSVPPEHRHNIEQTRPFGPADAYAYLRTAGVSTLTAQKYVGPGDRWSDEMPGTVPWTAATDRLLLAVLEPEHGWQELPAFALMRILADGRQLARARLICQCPKYDEGGGRKPGEEWIAWRRGDQNTKVDQWGLPDNTPAPSPQPGPGTPPPPVAGPTLLDPAALRFVGLWMEPTQGLLLCVCGDGTWAMVHTEAPQTTPRAGTWGLVGGRLTLRTCLSAPAQLWEPALPDRAAQQLTGGQHDLTMVFDLDRRDDLLLGTLRTWRVTTRPNGDLATFMAWNHPDNDPSTVMWTHVHTVFPPVQGAAGGQTISPGLRRILERIPDSGSGAGMHKRVHETFAEHGQAGGDGR